MTTEENNEPDNHEPDNNEPDFDNDMNIEIPPQDPIDPLSKIKEILERSTIRFEVAQDTNGYITRQNESGLWVQRMQITHAMNNYGVKVDVLDGYLNTLYTGREIAMVDALNIDTKRSIRLYRLIGNNQDQADEKLEVIQTAQVEKATESTKGIETGCPSENGLIYRISERLKKHFGKEITHYESMLMGVAPVAISLDQAIFNDLKGAIRPNLFICTIGESGFTSKTAKKNWLQSVTEKYKSVSEIAIFSSITQQEFAALANEWIDAHQTTRDPTLGYPVAIIRDEATDLMKQMKQRNSPFVDVPEALSQYYDGYGRAMLTRVDHRAKVKLHDFHCYVNLWIAATGTFLKAVENEHWEQGLMNRFIFLRIYPVDVDLPDYEHNISSDSTVLAEAEKFKEEVAQYMLYMRQYTTVTMNPDAGHIWAEWAARYHKEGMAEIKENDYPDPFSVYKAKHEVTPIKLAICFAASRKSETSVNGTKVLIVTADDMQRAIDFMDEYVFPQSRVMIEEWSRLTGNDSSSWEKVDHTANPYVRLIEAYNKVFANKEGYEHYVFIGDNAYVDTKTSSTRADDLWISRSDVKRIAHFTAVEMDEVISKNRKFRPSEYIYNVIEVKTIDILGDKPLRKPKTLMRVRVLNTEFGIDEVPE